MRELWYAVPLAMPFIGFYEGRNGLYNRQYTPSAIGIQQCAYFLMLVALNVVYWIWRPPYISFYEVGFVDIMYLTRAAVVATKCRTRRINNYYY